MQARFLLGPAGSGKTFRCLAEIRAVLQREPEGLPLVLIAPKQATFQLERQLLAGDTIAGFTRLQILSFDRLAEFVFDRLNLAMPKLLSVEGRLMVLRALLRQHSGELKLLHKSARRIGFAQEIAGQLAELQQHQFGPARLRSLAADERLRMDLRYKLGDLAVLLEKYTDWQKDHDLQDVNCLLDIAADRLKGAWNQTRNGDNELPNRGRQEVQTLFPEFQLELPAGCDEVQGTKCVAAPLPFAIEHLWLDGFAEMTPQEHALLTATISFCKHATLAFCLETEPAPSDTWLSTWSAIGKTFQRCRAQITALSGADVCTEILPRKTQGGRFAEGSTIGALEAGWALPHASEIEVSNSQSEISITACVTPEAEATFAARELLKFMRKDPRNRFRDCAVLVRNLESYHHAIAQVFRRYEIPFFLDRRESVAHHPLAELTRNALRTVAGDWQHDDWFSALKAGFTTLPETNIDRLENMALEFGWHGKKWREPLPDEACEGFRQSVFPPFESLYRRLYRLKFEPTGSELAETIQEFWNAMAVEETLEDWSLPNDDYAPSIAQHALLHQTVYDQMQLWLENVSMAFPCERMSLRDWLPILDAGLAGLTVGVIPPALDEVLVGAIDRARNPDLKFTLLLGVNESIFPALPSAPSILTNSDREELDKQNASLGTGVLDQISRERYLGYIACTRASEKLVITFARQDAAGRALNPSPFVAQLRKAFPQLTIDEFSGMTGWGDAEHPREIIARMVEAARIIGEPPKARDWAALMELPRLKILGERLGKLKEPDETESLLPALAAKIYGQTLRSSVSRLEEFAECPFRFFVHSGLRAEERRTYELDARERGNFQHQILEKFHDELAAEGKRWRDITPEEARERVGKIAAAVAQDYREGLLRVDDESRFTARALTMALQNFVATLVTWMRGQYEFNPAKAETGFGLDDDSGLPAWKIDLGNDHALALRGRVDRVDLCDVGDKSLAVVMDYKSSKRKLDNILVEHGVQLQLLGYLATVRRWPDAFFGGKKIVPAGVFYVNLRGQFEGGDSRTEVLAEAEVSRRLAYRHSGRFNAAYIDYLDRTHACDQFNYRLNKDGTVRSNSTEALSGEKFNALIDQVETRLQAIGRDIYAGKASVDPYQKGGLKACDKCDYRAACRIDEWTHEFRELRAAAKPAGESEET